MLAPYLALLRTPGALAFSSLGFVARLPLAMLGIGVVLLVSEVTRSYGLAGAVSAVAMITTSVAAPVQARLVDRFGQSRVLRPLLVVHVVSGGSFLLFVERGAPTWSWFLSAALVGASLPGMGSLVRARWSHLHAGTPRLHTAYAYESVLDEVIFIVGPVLVTVLATQAHRLVGLGTAFVLTGVGGAAFAALRGSEPPAHPGRGKGRRDPMPVRQIAGPVIAFMFLGGVFGSIEVITVAFADEAGQRGAAGPILAVFAAGSLIAGIVFGAVQWRSGPRRRFAIGTTVLAVAMVPLPVVPSLAWLAIAIFIAGFTISPTLITGFSLVATTVPPSRLTEGLAWQSTALGTGVALGASVAGPIVDSAGASTAYLVPLVCAALTAVVGVVSAMAIRRHRASAQDPPVAAERSVTN